MNLQRDTSCMEKKQAGADGEICIILSTVPPALSAALAKSLLEKNIAACINILPVRSLYRWKGEFSDDEEHLLVIKTRRGLADAVIQALRARHPYEVPEIIALPDGFKRRYMLSAFGEMMKGYARHFDLEGMPPPKHALKMPRRAG